MLFVFKLKHSSHMERISNDIFYKTKKHWGLKIDGGGRRGHVLKVVGFKATYSISAYHH